MFGFSLYGSVLVVHVLSAIILVGATMLWPSVLGAMRGAGSIAELRGVLDFLRRALKSKPVVALVLLASGIYLGSAGWWTEGWFYVSVAAWIANSAIAAAVVERSVKTLTAAVAKAPDGAVGADIDRLREGAGLRFGSAAMAANDIMLTYVMFAKPSLAGSLVLAFTAQAVALGVAQACIAAHAMAGNRQNEGFASNEVTRRAAM